MEIQLLRTAEDFEKIRTGWDGLLEKSGGQSVFLTWEWLYYWWIHFNADKELLILVVRNKKSNEILGIAPFCIQRKMILRFIPMRAVKFLGTEAVHSDFLDFIMLPGMETEILGAVYEYLNKNNHLWDIVEVTDVEENSDSLNFFRKRASGKYRIAESVAQRCPYLNLPNDYDLLSQSLSRNMRENLKRRTKRIENKKGMHFSILKDGAIKDSVDKLFILHNDRFKYKKKSDISESVFNGIEIKHFHYDIASNFLRRNWLKLYFLNLGNEPIACLYAFKYKSSLFYYQSGSRPDWSGWGLGTALFGYAIKDSINEGLKEFHYLRGNEAYKSRWTKKAKTTKNIILIKKNIIGYLYILIVQGKINLKKIFRMVWGKRGQSL